MDKLKNAIDEIDALKAEIESRIMCDIQSAISEYERRTGGLQIKGVDAHFVEVSTIAKKDPEFKLAKVSVDLQMP